MDIFDYDNILLLPRKCRVDSRSECDASVAFGPRHFRLPVVPANMKTVVNEDICVWLAQAGCLVHARFDFPFQIYSILQLFLLECAILFTIARRPSAP